MVVIQNGQKRAEVRSARILVLVPAFNEQTTVGEVVRQIRSVNPSYNILVIDDASTDATVVEALRAGANVATLPFNLRVGAAVQTGFKYADQGDYDVVIQVDGDGQHDPGFMDVLINPILERRADIAIGSRYLCPDNKKQSFARNIGIRFFSGLSSHLTGNRITDCSSGFRALNHRAYRFFAEHYPIDFPDAEAIILAHRAGLKIVEIPVRFRERNGGESSLRFWRMVYYPFKEILAIIVLLTKKVEPAHD